MRLAVLSDIHGNLHALEAVLASLRQHTPDLVWCAGDLVGYGAYPEEVTERIRALGMTVVAGNYDEAVGYDRPVCGCDFSSEKDRRLGEASLMWTRERVSAGAKSYLRALPGEVRQELEGLGLLMVHGSPRSTSEYIREDSTEAMEEIALTCGAGMVLFGHTHIPFDREAMGVRFVNAGSVGRPKDGDPRACYCLIDVPLGPVSFIRVPYPVEEAALAVESSGLPPELGRHLREGKA